MNGQEIKIFLTFFFIYSFFVQWNSWNEESRFALTKAITDEVKFEIDSFYNQTGDRSYYKGHYYTDKEPGLSFLAIPIYWIWKSIYNFLSLSVNKGSQVFSLVYTFNSVPLVYVPDPGIFLRVSMMIITIFTSSLFGALTVLLVYKILGYFTREERYKLLITLSFGLGSLVFPYSLVFLDHIPEGFFLFSAFYLLFRSKTEKLSSEKIFILSGTLLGFGAAIRLTASIFIVLSIFYIFSYNKKKLPLFLLGCIIGLLPYLIYTRLLTGAVLLLRSSDPSIWSGAFSKVVKVFSTKIPFLNLPFVIERDFLGILLTAFIYPARGLFFFYPILAFAMVGLFYMYKQYKPETLLILFLFILVSFMIYGSNYGFSFGPRHLYSFVPFLMIPLFFALKKFKMRIFVLFLIFSVFINLLGLQYWEGTDIRTYEKILKNPIFEHYLPLFYYNGPRSRILESLLLDSRIDIRNEPHSCGLTPPVLQKDEISLFSLLSVGFITLRIPFLSLISICIITFLIWRKEISKKIKLSHKQKMLIFLILILFFILGFIRIRTFLHGDNWHAPEFNDDGKIKENERWMSQNATLLLFNKESIVKKINLLFDIETFNKTRNLVIYLNSESINSYKITNNERIEQQMNLKPGKNEVKFYSVEGCDRPTELDLVECDLRCLSFKIRNILID
jgi:hypothetical protein